MREVRQLLARRDVLQRGALAGNSFHRGLVRLIGRQPEIAAQYGIVAVERETVDIVAAAPVHAASHVIGVVELIAPDMHLDSRHAEAVGRLCDDAAQAGGSAKNLALLDLVPDVVRFFQLDLFQAAGVLEFIPHGLQHGIVMYRVLCLNRNREARNQANA